MNGKVVVLSVVSWFAFISPNLVNAQASTNPPALPSPASSNGDLIPLSPEDTVKQWKQLELANCDQDTKTHPDIGKIVIWSLKSKGVWAKTPEGNNYYAEILNAPFDRNENMQVFLLHVKPEIAIQDNDELLVKGTFVGADRITVKLDVIEIKNLSALKRPKYIPSESEVVASKLLQTENHSKNLSLSKNPKISILLNEAGYTQASKVQIYKSSISLEDQNGYPALDAFYFIYSTQGKYPQVEKIKVVLFNHREQVANLLAYAPMLVYVHGDANGAELQTYLSAEAFSGQMNNSYAVYPNNVGAYIFSYDGEIMKGNPPREVFYKDIFKLILKGLDDVSGKGKAQMLVDEGGKFHLTSFQKIYPK